jgi:hypothetical protein
MFEFYSPPIDYRPSRVRLITRGRYNSIDEATREIRQKRFVIDDGTVIPGVDGISDFDALHSGRHNDEVCAFDIIVEVGDDLRKLSMRGANLERLLARRPEGHLRQSV